MSPLARNIALFGTSCVLTGGAWWLAWPQTHRPQPIVVSSASVPDARPWTKLRTMDLIHRLDSAATDQACLNAAGKLTQIPEVHLAEALELATLVRDHKLTLAAKVLLIRWAASDGDAACRWAWQRLRADGLWESAFREMGPSWAGRHPQSLEKWAIAHYPKSSDSIRKQAGMASDEPILDFEMLSKVSKWLIREDPRAAFTVLQARGGWGSDDRLPESLQTVDEIRHALLAFDHLDKMTPNHFSGREIWAQGLLARWSKIDPEDFSHSPYSGFFKSKPADETTATLPDNLESALARADQQSPAQRHSGLMQAFDAWTKAHPGERPDTTGWSPVRQRAWEDFEALKP